MPSVIRRVSLFNHLFGRRGGRGSFAAAPIKSRRCTRCIALEGSCALHLKKKRQKQRELNVWTGCILGARWPNPNLKARLVARWYGPRLVRLQEQISRRNISVHTCRTVFKARVIGRRRGKGEANSGGKRQRRS